MKLSHIFADKEFESRGIKFINSLKEKKYEIIPCLRSKNQSYIKFVLKTVKKILKNKPDMIHAHRISGFVPAIIIKIIKPRTKIIYDKHDIHKYDFIFDNLLFFANYVLVASDLHLSCIRKRKKNSEVIHNYTNFKPVSRKKIQQIRKKIKLKKNDVFLLFQGSIVPEYGLQMLIESLPKINKKVKVIIIGWIKDQEYWDKLQKKLTDNVIYLGAKNYNEMNDYVGASDIGVILFEKSKLTDFGNPAKLFEFINCKVPVIVTNVISVTRYVKKYKNGIIVKNKNELANAINKIISKKIRQKYSKRSPILSWDEDFKKYEKILEKLKWARQKKK